jgi:hypothetical protein
MMALLQWTAPSPGFAGYFPASGEEMAPPALRATSPRRGEEIAPAFHATPLYISLTASPQRIDAMLMYWYGWAGR